MKTLSFILSLLISITSFSQAGAYLHDLESANAVNANDSLPVWQLDGKTRSTTLQKVKDFIGAEPAIIAPLQVARYMNGYKKFVSFNADSIPSGNTNKYYSNALVQAFSDTRYSLLGHIHAASEITSGNLAYQRMATGTPQVGYVPVYNNGGIITWQAQSGANYNAPLYKDGNGFLSLPAANSTTDGYFPASLYNILMGKQDSLRSGITLKTINNTSLLGPGNIDISAGGTVTTDATPTSGSTNPVQSDGVYNALLGKVNNSVTVNGQPLTGNVTLSKSDVGLSNVDNTSDATKNSAAVVLTNKDLSSPTNTFPSSLATLSGAQTLTNKTLASPIITSPSGLTKADVGLGNVDNTSDANKPISTATQAALNAKQNSLTPVGPLQIDNSNRIFLPAYDPETDGYLPGGTLLNYATIGDVEEAVNQKDTINVKAPLKVDTTGGKNTIYQDSADAAHPGYLGAYSYNKFNNKQEPLTPGPGISIVNGVIAATSSSSSSSSASSGLKSFSLSSPRANENIALFYTSSVMNLTDVRSVLSGTSPSVTYTLNWGSRRDSAERSFVTNQTATSTTTGSIAILDTSAIPSGKYVWVTTSGVSGTINDWNLTLSYQAPSFTKGITLISPTGTENVTVFYTSKAITITEVRDVVQGASPSYTYSIVYGASRAAADGTIVASHSVMNSTTGVAEPLTTTTIPAGSYIWAVASAQSNSTEVQINTSYQ